MTEFRAAEVSDFNGKIIAEFRANGGKVGGQFQGADILLLHHTGARSGRQRVSPLAFQWVGQDLPHVRSVRVEGCTAQDPRGGA